MTTFARKNTDRNYCEPPVIAWLTKSDFARARKYRGFSIWADWREFRDERDALFLGYSWAGLTAVRQQVPFISFRRWTRLTGASFDIRGLDEFASHWRWRLAHPDASIIGRFRVTDEQASDVGVHGAQCVPVCADLFRLLSDAFIRLDQFLAPNLDDYAAHSLSCCLTLRT